MATPVLPTSVDEKYQVELVRPVNEVTEVKLPGSTNTEVEIAVAEIQAPAPPKIAFGEDEGAKKRLMHVMSLATDAIDIEREMELNAKLPSGCCLYCYYGNSDFNKTKHRKFRELLADPSLKAEVEISGMNLIKPTRDLISGIDSLFVPMREKEYYNLYVLNTWGVVFLPSVLQLEVCVWMFPELNISNVGLVMLVLCTLLSAVASYAILHFAGSYKDITKWIGQTNADVKPFENRLSELNEAVESSISTAMKMYPFTILVYELGLSDVINALPVDVAHYSLLAILIMWTTYVHMSLAPLFTMAHRAKGWMCREMAAAYKRTGLIHPRFSYGKSAKAYAAVCELAGNAYPDGLRYLETHVENNTLSCQLC